jgi:hypothetical protein
MSGKSPIHSSRRLVPGSRLVGSDLRTCHRFWSDYGLTGSYSGQKSGCGKFTVSPDRYRETPLYGLVWPPSGWSAIRNYEQEFCCRVSSSWRDTAHWFRVPRHPPTIPGVSCSLSLSARRQVWGFRVSRYPVRPSAVSIGIRHIRPSHRIAVVKKPTNC